MPKLNPDIFILAAEQIHNYGISLDNYCCHTLKSICREKHISAKPYLKILQRFMPTDKEWEEEFPWHAHHIKPINRVWWCRNFNSAHDEYRIFALLLCAEMLNNP